MNYESMTDRELDALVAEKVMGWKRGRLEYGDMPWYPPGSSRHTSGGTLNLPKYSSEVEQAFSVVEAMRERGWEISVRSDEDIWDVMLTKPITPIIPGRFIYSEAKSLPRAICIAALRALDE